MSVVAAGRSRRAGLAGLGAALLLASVPARAGDEGDLFDRAGWSRLVAGRQPAWDNGSTPPLLLEVDVRPRASTAPAVPKSEPPGPSAADGGRDPARPEDSRPRSARPGPAEPRREPTKPPAATPPKAAAPPGPASAPPGSLPAAAPPRAAEDLFDRAGWAAPPAVRPAWVDGARPTE